MAGHVDDADAKENFKRTEAIINSMTLEERRKPEIIRASRRNRIAMGSGTSTTEVNRLLNQYSKMQKQMRTFSRMFKGM